MKKIGNDGVVDKENYKTWPLFYKLRKEDKFKETFREIFDEEYTVLEIPQRPVQELMEEIFKKNNEVKSKTVKVPIKKESASNVKVKTVPIKKNF